jgi:hypothetical protein
MIRDLGDRYKMVSPKPFVLCFRNIFYFIQETLCSLQTWEGDMLAYAARRFAIKKV